jgi:hypothetical protein
MLEQEVAVVVILTVRDHPWNADRVGATQALQAIRLGLEHRWIPVGRIHLHEEAALVRVEPVGVVDAATTHGHLPLNVHGSAQVPAQVLRKTLGEGTGQGHEQERRPIWTAFQWRIPESNR